jgi:CRP/FNR family transcriptional regulator
LNSLQLFLEQQPVKQYKKGDVILQQDAVPSSAFVIKQGIVKTYNITSKGEEKPIGFSIKNELLPLGWIFGKIFKAQYYYEALCDCHIYCVQPDSLLAFLRRAPQAMYQVLDRCVWDTLNHEMRINALEQSKASDKILHTIHYLALCFGRDLQPDVVEIPLPLTQQDVANFTGLTRETISVELKKLAKEKVIFYRNRSYVVLTDRLNELLDDEYEHRLVRE